MTDQLKTIDCYSCCHNPYASRAGCIHSERAVGVVATAILNRQDGAISVLEQVLNAKDAQQREEAEQKAQSWLKMEKHDYPKDETG